LGEFRTLFDWLEHALTINGPIHKAADALKVVGTKSKPAAQSVNVPLSATEQPTSFAPQFLAHTNLPAGAVFPTHELTAEVCVRVFNLLLGASGTSRAIS
jgi:hypothetical protein